MSPNMKNTSKLSRFANNDSSLSIETENGLETFQKIINVIKDKKEENL